MKERPKTLLLTAAGTISAFLAYCFFIRDDMINIFMVTPREYLFSYGAFTYMDGLMKNLYPELAETALPIVHKILLAIASLLTGCCFVLAARNPLPENTDTAHIDAFRMGSGIYAGTFFLGNNLEYRLVFLLLTMPQLLAWAKYRSRPSAMASAAIALIIIRCWASVWGDIIPLFRVTYLVKNLTEWAVFAILIYMSVQTLPLWIKERLSFRTS